MSDSSSLLQVQDLSVHFGQGPKIVRAVEKISFQIGEQETLAIVGESGSGKSVTAHALLRLLPLSAVSHLSGHVRFENRDLLNCSEKDIQDVRGNDVAMIFQEPM
ncbi:MAG: ABC transporter ATP-binding protein, partial [bacterium]|nr:ABC transporter ATP-binding protein [bacterium]